MRRELSAGNRSIFSQLLQQKLQACFAQGRQAMLFLNRRGYNTFVSCRNCGYVVKCPQCDVSMIVPVSSSQTGPLTCRVYLNGEILLEREVTLQ